MQWLIENKEWFFSGAGIFLTSTIFTIIKRRDNAIKQSQKSGEGSTNYQAARDIKIGRKDD